MTAYLIIEIVDVKDADTYAAYRDKAPAEVKAGGGTYLVRGGDPEVLEGDWNPSRVVILRFKDRQSAKTWWASDSYHPVKALRTGATHSRMVLVDGTEGVPV